MKFPVPKFDRRADAERGWPGSLFGGHLRTSTVVLLVAFVVIGWVYDINRPAPNPVEAPSVVPPGFIPDPNYTWVPRTRLQQPTATVTETVTPTTTTEPSPAEPTPPPPPFCPPFCPPPPPGAPPPPPGAPPPGQPPPVAPAPPAGSPAPPATAPPAPPPAHPPAP